MRIEVLACSVVVATCAACSDGGSPAAAAETSACQPFEIETSEIELGTVIAAGRDQGGTLYVVDDVDGELRAFVGSERSLTRVSVAGGSSSYDGELRRDVLEIEAQPRWYALVVEQTETTVRMARTLEVERDPMIDTLPESALLEPVEPSAFEDAELHDLPSEVAVEYLARQPDGALVLIIRPEQPEGLDYDAFRVFYGEDGELVECEVTSVVRARDGGSTHVVFTLDGAPADAYFPVEASEDGFQPGPATLDYDGEVVPLERLDPAANVELLAEARFECLE